MPHGCQPLLSLHLPPHTLEKAGVAVAGDATREMANKVKVVVVAMPVARAKAEVEVELTRTLEARTS